MLDAFANLLCSKLFWYTVDASLSASMKYYVFHIDKLFAGSFIIMPKYATVILSYNPRT